MYHRLARATALGLAAAVLAAGCSQSSGASTSSSPPASASTLVVHQEGEAMTRAGSCTSTSTSYAGLLCKGDAVSGSADFAQAARYRVVVHGASSVAGPARVGVYIGGVRAAGLVFTGTAFTDVAFTWDVTSPGVKEVRFLLEVDDGSSDTYVDWYELWSEGPIPPPPEPPAPPPESAYASGVYRNLFKEWDPSITDAQIQTRLGQWWDSLFASTDDTKRLYYPFGTNANGALAYIKDVGDNDIRSEGMSYGMMIAVQLNKQAEFNALWNFAKSNMQHQTGARKGYFAWQVSTSGSIMDQNPASDGEEYFATALFFAGHRWGNGTGIYGYTAEANAILDTMLHKEDMNAGVLEGVSDMFNRTQKQVVFVPYYTSANFTDPSYHLPAFYELWGRWAAGWNGQTAADRQFWLDAAATSRAFFPKAAHATTGLSPDYAEFSGAPNTTGNHADFRFDAWRVAMNWAVDYSWFRLDANQPVLADRLQAFLHGQGITSYANQFTLAGASLSSDHSPGLVACTGVASLAATNARRLEFVRELWNLNPPTGQWRYYDGLLSFMSLLHASGNFKIWMPGGGTAFALTVTKAGAGSGTVSSTPAGVSCGTTCSASFASGTSVTLSAAAASGATFSGWGGACTGTAATCTVTMSQARSVTATFDAPAVNYTLTVTLNGTGGGMVGSPALDCGSGTCSASFAYGTSITLLAIPAHGSLFSGWSGACSGYGGCIVSMTEARSVTATFNRGSITTLDVTLSGTGSGTVTSSPEGVSCGIDCSGSYASDTTVTLTAAPASGSTFAGWGGACSGTAATCTVAMAISRTVTATFTAGPTTYTLDVTRSGLGSGTVTSSPAGVSCGTACSASFASDTAVTLTAAAASGSAFTGWGGACSGTSATCVVSMSAAKSVTATFGLNPILYALTVTRAGTGGGTVTSSPAGVSCGTTCSATFGNGALITLTASPASGSRFAGWGGACTGTALTCTVTMSAARSVTATFDPVSGTPPCANAVTLTSGNSGNFNTTGAACYRTAASVGGWGCYNMTGRTVSVNGVAATCGQSPLPAKWSDGYHYFAFTAGTYPWAGFYYW